MAVINTADTSFDKIWAYYKSPKKFQLTPNQELVKERWMAAWTSLLAKNSKTQTVEILREAYGYGRAQAFRDIRNAERLFGQVMRADREGQMALMYEFALEAFKKCIDAGQMKEARAFFTEMRECIGKEDPIHFNPAKLEDKPTKISIPKEVIAAIVEQLSGGVLDFNNLTVEDIEHEDIIEDDED